MIFHVVAHGTWVRLVESGRIVVMRLNEGEILVGVEKGFFVCDVDEIVGAERCVRRLASLRLVF